MVENRWSVFGFRFLSRQHSSMKMPLNVLFFLFFFGCSFILGAHRTTSKAFQWLRSTVFIPENVIENEIIPFCLKTHTGEKPNTDTDYGQMAFGIYLFIKAQRKMFFIFFFNRRVFIWMKKRKKKKNIETHSAFKVSLLTAAAVATIETVFLLCFRGIHFHNRVDLPFGRMHFGYNLSISVGKMNYRVLQLSIKLKLKSKSIFYFNFAELNICNYTNVVLYMNERTNEQILLKICS